MYDTFRDMQQLLEEHSGHINVLAGAGRASNRDVRPGGPFEVASVVDPVTFNGLETTPLMKAAHAGHTKVVDVLVRQRACRRAPPP